MLLVALGQGAQSALFIAAVGGNQVSTVNFGYPLNQLLAADSALATIQREQHAGSIVVSMPSRYTASAMDSTLIREEADRTGVTGDCLALPDAQAGPTLVVSTRAASPQGQLLATLPNATHVQDIAMPGDEPLVIYRLSGPTPLLSDERALPSVTWQDGSGDTLRLVAGARVAPGVIRLRWVVGQWTIPHDVNGEDTTAMPQFEIQLRRAGQGNAQANAPVARATCQPTRLQPGETLFTWVSTAWSANGTSLTAVAPPLPASPLTLSALHGDAVRSGRVGLGRCGYSRRRRWGGPLTPMSTTSANGVYQLPDALTGAARREYPRRNPPRWPESLPPLQGKTTRRIRIRPPMPHQGTRPPRRAIASPGSMRSCFWSR